MDTDSDCALHGAVPDDGRSYTLYSSNHLEAALGHIRDIAMDVGYSRDMSAYSRHVLMLKALGQLEFVRAALRDSRDLLTGVKFRVYSSDAGQRCACDGGDHNCTGAMPTGADAIL